MAAFPQHDGQVHPAVLRSRARSWDGGHEAGRSAATYGGYRIPDERFEQYFERGHFFRIGGLPLVFVGGVSPGTTGIG